MHSHLQHVSRWAGAGAQPGWEGLGERAQPSTHRQGEGEVPWAAAPQASPAVAPAQEQPQAPGAVGDSPAGCRWGKACTRCSVSMPAWQQP